MTENLYLDTHIWRDYFEDRVDNLRPLGEFAYNILKRAINGEFMIITSDVVVKELQKAYTRDEIDKHMFKQLVVVNRLRIVNTTRDQYIEAKKISGDKNIPILDVLHAILARDNNAILVSRDAHHELLRDTVDVCKPEEL